MLDQYVIWIPEHDGHAPPYFKSNMLWGDLIPHPKLFDSEGGYQWLAGEAYPVPADAINGK